MLTGSAHMSIQGVRWEDASSFVPEHVDVASGTSSVLWPHSAVAIGKASSAPAQGTKC